MLEQLKLGKNIMNLLPDKNLIIVTSALAPNIGVIPNEERYKQTIDSLVSLRKHFPNDIIFFTDGSPNEVDQNWLENISNHADIMAVWHQDKDVNHYASGGMKSQAELVLLMKTINVLYNNPDLMNMMHSVKRIFKYSARTVLLDEFDIKEYDGLFGKYVFKKAVPSWMPDEAKLMLTDHLYITRMYSLCPSLVKDYMATLMACLDNTNQGLDTEHAHHMNIDKQYVIEFDKLHCSGIMASTGTTEVY